MDEEKIAKLIKDRKFSELCFIENIELLDKKHSYYGFLYFILDLKEENNYKILDKIIEIKGNISKAYEYLGDVASKIYSSIDETHIPSEFYKKSIKEDKNNAESWWKLCITTHNILYLYHSLRSHKIKNEKENISIKLKDRISLNYHSLELKKSEWQDLLNILIDAEPIEKDHIGELLSLAYFHTDQIKKGVEKIRTSNKIHPEILIKYLELNAIKKEDAANKVHEFQLERILPDPKENYVQTRRLLKNDKITISKEELIRKAFKAECYDDVIEIYTQPINTKITKSTYLSSELYLVLSQMLLEKELDKDALDKIKTKKMEGKILSVDSVALKVFEIKMGINNLKNELNSHQDYDLPLSNRSEYLKIKSSLEDENIIENNLYHHLIESNNNLKKEWDNRYNKYILKKGIERNKSNQLSYDSIINYCVYGIEHSLFDDVLDKLFTYHKKNTPTSRTLYYIAICFERKDRIESAFHYYEKAALLSEDKKERDYVLILDLLRSSKRADKGLNAEDFSRWRCKLNSYLVSSFQWSLFHSKTRPGRLYKYSDFNMNTLDSIDSQYFYLAKKEQLNDPIEMPEIIKNEDCLIDSNYRVCSFSRNENSMLMWSHYSNNHQGIMVEYQFGPGLPASTGIGKVQYTTNQVRNIEKNQYIFNQYLLTKNKEWSYEEEVRLMSYCIDKIYYNKHQHPNPDRSKLNAFISSITLGYNFPESKLNLIINLVKKINTSREEVEEKVKLRKAVFSTDNLFSLDYIELDI